MQDRERVPGADEPSAEMLHASLQQAAESAPSSELTSETATDAEIEDPKEKMLNRFVEHIALLDAELKPLQQWSETFTVVRKSDQVSHSCLRIGVHFSDI